MRRISFLAAILVSLALLPNSRATGEELDIDVMTFNVRGGDWGSFKKWPWSSRHKTVCKIIAQAGPEIIGTQELWPTRVKDILNSKILKSAGYNYAKTGTNYEYILYRKGKFTLKESGNFYLSDTPTKKSKSKSWGNKWIRNCSWARFQCKTTKKTFYVYNTHLSVMSTKAREKGANLIASRIAKRKYSKDPFIITGDMNCRSSSYPIKHFKSQIKVAIAANHRVDYVLSSPGLTVLKATVAPQEVDGKPASDHRAVQARLRLPGKTVPLSSGPNAP